MLLRYGGKFGSSAFKSARMMHQMRQEEENYAVRGEAD